MTVYVEYVLIDNFFIDFMLMKTAFYITGKTVSRFRLAACSLLGAVFALFYPLITDNAFIITAAKILFGLTLTFIAAKFSRLKDYAAFTAVFIGLTFFTGGAIIGVFSVFGIDYSSEYSVALMVLPVYIAFTGVKRLIRYFYRKKDAFASVVDAEITFCGKTVKIRGFFDTGNGLYKDFSPVVIVSKKTLTPFITPLFFKNAKSVNVKTVNGSERKICFKPDLFVIYSGGEKNIYNNVAVAVTRQTFDGYDAILHPALMGKNTEKNNENQTAVETEKAS